VAFGWHKLARLYHADWQEIRSRGGQELHKRSELLRYRMGMRPERIALQSPAAEGDFFFAGGAASARAGLLRLHLPDQVEAIVREADEVCQHRFRLLGYEGLDYGPEIDWHLDRVHGKRAPIDPWFKIPFLDFAVVGDHKITWELNRHRHLVTLAKAGLLTKNEKYVRELVAQWRGWIRANPYPLGINWGSSLEVAFRSLSWIWVDQLLAGDAAAAELRAELLPALAFHGRYIERYLSTYFSPNTHLLGEALALFFIGTLYPQMPHAAGWKDEGWEILLQEAGRQVRPDGVYFEQSLYYHVYALDFFLHARLLAARNNVAVPEEYDDVVRRMLDVVEALAQTGVAEGFGDDDGGRLFNPRRNRTEYMTDTLALGALSYGRNDFGAARLTEEAIWLFGESALSLSTRAQPGRASAPRPTSFPDGGLYILTGSEPYPQAMMIDAGPQGVGRCGHGHADALSLRLTMNGSRWLVDSGSGVYISSDAEERNAFRGTAAHSTLRVDGVDQAVPGEPFSWTGIPTTRVENWTTGKTFAYFSGGHDGYERLADPVTHRRSVLRVNGDGGIWLVRDVALGAAEHDLELNWHFARDVVMREVGPAEFVAVRPREATDGDNKSDNENENGESLRLIMSDQAEWKARIAQDRISPAYGRYESAPVLRCTARVRLPAEIATALIADVRSDVSGPSAIGMSMFSAREAAVQVYELRDDADHHTFFFARGKQAWHSGPWSSDAEVLYCRVENEKLIHLIVIGGSSAAWRGEPILNAAGPFQYFEWRRRDGIIESDRDTISTTPAFDELIMSLNCSSAVSHPTSTYAEKP
jgi:Heparinase II/III-like protein/Heparinase II/III N-terminus